MNTEVIQDTHVIVRVTGEMDLHNVADFRKALAEAAELSPQGFIIDLSGLMYIDSAGVQAIIVACLKVNKANGHIALVMGNDRIRSVLEVVHLEMLPRMLVRDDLEAAKQAMSEVLSR